MAEKIFFITGIDTNIGKTFCSSLLLSAIKEKGIDAGYMKPVETGVEIGKDGSRKYIDGLYVKTYCDLKENLDVITPYTFRQPLSPYAAIKKEGGELCIKEILFKFYELNKIHDYMLVEGAGGMLVPLKRGHFMIDIAKYLDAGVVLVTKAGLGMINQTLLSIEYALNKGIKMSGIIINNVLGENDESVSSNKEILCEFTDVPIIGEIPYIPKEKRYGEIKVHKDFALKYIDLEKILL